MSTSPAELPSAGDTAPAARGDHLDRSGTFLTLSEAATRYEVSVATLRRRLDDGAIPGAHKVPGPTGETWQIPAEVLAGRYLERDTSPPPEPPPPPGASELLALVDRLATLLEGERAQLMAAESDRTNARAEAAAAMVRAEMLAADLERERARAVDLEAALAAERERAANLAGEKVRADQLAVELERAGRRWWRKG